MSSRVSRWIGVSLWFLSLTAQAHSYDQGSHPSIIGDKEVMTLVNVWVDVMPPRLEDYRNRSGALPLSSQAGRSLAKQLEQELLASLTQKTGGEEHQPHPQPHRPQERTARAFLAQVAIEQSDIQPPSPFSTPRVSTLHYGSIPAKLTLVDVRTGERIGPITLLFAADQSALLTEFSSAQLLSIDGKSVSPDESLQANMNLLVEAVKAASSRCALDLRTQGPASETREQRIY